MTTWQVKEHYELNGKLIIQLEETTGKANPVQVTWNGILSKYEWAGWGLKMDTAYEEAVDDAMRSYFAKIRK
jgi:hypothetical protein